MDFYSGFAVVISSQKSLIRPGPFIGMALSYPGPAGWAVLEPTRQGGLCEHVPQHIGQGWSSGHGPGAANGAGLFRGSPQWLSQTPQARSKLVPGAAWLLGCFCTGEKCFHVLNLLH